MHRELLINGVFLGGSCDGGIGKTQHYAPYNGNLVGTAAEAGWDEMSVALDAAQEAYQTWKFSPRRQRRKLLNTIAQNVEAQQEDLSRLLAEEVGKPVVQARAEVKRLQRTFELAADLLTQEHNRIVPLDYDDRGDDYRCEVRRVPIGVVMAIVPYNWPFNLAAHKIAPALAAGNTVVAKTPSVGTLSTLTLARIIHESGCPDGVVNLLNCPSTIAQKAVEDPRTDMLSFTGSPPVGWKLKGLIPKKKVALELGGDATSVVAADANLDFAVKQLVVASFAYAGQICISCQHILVHESIYNEFKDRFVEATEAIKTGDPLDEEVVCGPVVREEAADRILDWVSQAEEAGATVLTGGQRTGLVIEPVVIENVKRNTPLGKEEVFGPVVTLQPYSDPQEAINWINASQFGIHASLFTQDMVLAERFAHDIEIGGLIVGDSPALRFDSMPYGGVKNSGFGREGVLNTFFEMTEDKTVVYKVR